ncbi:MAG: hypothetical protein ACI4TX_03540, partial [Christensenellales bacterium]
TVIIETEKEKQEIKFKGSNKVQSKKINVAGVMVKFTFVSNDVECEISHPTIEFNLGKPNSEK